MTDLIEQGATWLETMRKQFTASTVVYSRGAASVPLAGTRGRSTFEDEDANGTAITVASWDWIIGTADLVLSDAATLPLPGDKITVGGVVYEVMSNPNGQAAYGYANAFRTQLRIHTREVKGA